MCLLNCQSYQSYDCYSTTAAIVYCFKGELKECLQRMALVSSLNKRKGNLENYSCMLRLYSFASVYEDATPIVGRCFFSIFKSFYKHRQNH